MLKKILFRPGTNRESTRYAAEVIATSALSGAQVVGGWYECDKVRFRSGNAEKIGGWRRVSNNTFLGVCRSLLNWSTLAGSDLMGVATNLKFYVEDGGVYNDITPVRGTATLTNPFTATAGSAVISVADVGHGAVTGDFVTFSGATGLGGNITAAVLNAEHQITVVSADAYTITVSATANATDAASSPAGGSVTAEYQINVGPEISTPTVGWGSGGWGVSPWGQTGAGGVMPLRLWSQSNFGEDLVFGPRGGEIYYCDVSAGLGNRAVAVSTLAGASDVPVVQNGLLVSDTSRFVFAFGCNELGGTTQDPMLIRWSDQESAVNWTPDPTNQAGDIRLSQGSQIVSWVQTRQEILVFTNAALYSLQYVGQPAVWKTDLMGSNISIVSQNAVTAANGSVFWMGSDKFYRYDGRVQTMRCDLRQHVFGDFNASQSEQVFSGSNEGFNEVWWFYCSANSNEIDCYVIYNYVDDIWYYGTMQRTAWHDSALRAAPYAACYSGVLVAHETGVDDNETETTTAINAYVCSTEFDIDDGHNFGFVWRLLPDITFRGSEPPMGVKPSATVTLTPLSNSGAGYTSPASVAGTSNAVIQRTAVAPVEEFTGQVYIRVRGRQLTFKIESNQIGCQWQLGAPRIDIREDGRRS